MKCIKSNNVRNVNLLSRKYADLMGSLDERGLLRMFVKLSRVVNLTFVFTFGHLIGPHTDSGLPVVGQTR